MRKNTISITTATRTCQNYAHACTHKHTHTHSHMHIHSHTYTDPYLRGSRSDIMSSICGESSDIISGESWDCTVVWTTLASDFTHEELTTPCCCRCCCCCCCCCCCWWWWCCCCCACNVCFNLCKKRIMVDNDFKFIPSFLLSCISSCYVSK